MKFTNFKISRESMFPIGNIAHVCSGKIFYQISAHFRNPGFRSVSKPRKPVLIFRTGLTTTFKAINNNYWCTNMLAVDKVISQFIDFRF